jgi:hypothetical protein
LIAGIHSSHYLCVSCGIPDQIHLILLVLGIRLIKLILIERVIRLEVLFMWVFRRGRGLCIFFVLLRWGGLLFTVFVGLVEADTANKDATAK